MHDFKKELRKLDVDEFKVSEVAPSEDRGAHDTVQAQFGFGACGGRCFRCFECFRCFRCSECFRCSRCFRCF